MAKSNSPRGRRPGGSGNPRSGSSRSNSQRSSRPGSSRSNSGSYRGNSSRQNHSDSDNSEGKFRSDDQDSKGPKRTSFNRNFKGKKMGGQIKFNRPKRQGNFPDDQHKTDFVPRPSNEVRLNKFIANTGLCSRREADRLIESGVITINGKVVTQLGTKVKPTDVVHCEGQKLSTERPVYLLLNKPKDFITTVDDPQGRRTVLQLVHNACKERVYPVGRLDRMTTGLLLLTNDGEMTKRLTHPSHGVRKLYHVTTEKNVTAAHLKQLITGVMLEDGESRADEAKYVSGQDKKQVGLVLHSGKNRVVRRMFAELGYKVLKLDRVSFAGLTKKDLPRGRWRHLTEKEVNFLKMI